ncbi:hypothetical protein Tco_0149313 [Tanacetum coccineum]
MESSNSNSKERELQLTQRLAKQRHSNCMAWFEQLETHLHDLYLNSSSHAVDAFKPAFHSFFGEEHQTFRLKMFRNLDQLRLQLTTMIEMDKQISFLNEILYKRNQSIQTIHMLAPKCATYNGRSTFANPKYLKKAQSEKPRLYEIPYDTSDPANRFCPNGEETVTLEKESRSKLDKDKVKPYDYTYQNSLYETFKPPSKTYLDQLERAKEVRKTMWRKTFVRTKPNIAKNLAFLPISKSISKSRQLYNEMTNNFNHFRTICQQLGLNHNNSAFPKPNAKSME